VGRNALRRSAGKLLPVDIYERADKRYNVVWKDETGKRRFASRGSMAEAKPFQTQKIAELQRHRETRFDLDDKQMYGLARDLAASHGYTILQAVQEWYRAKGSTNTKVRFDCKAAFIGSPATFVASSTKSSVRHPRSKCPA
jgi:hypothetical protein